MAREIEERRSTEAPPRVPGPPEPSEKRPARWLPWVGVVVLVGLLGGLLLFMRSKPATHPSPVNSVGASAGGPARGPVPAPSIPPAAPVTTLQDFAALSSEQKGVVMEQALLHYFGVVDDAAYTLNPGLLSEVTTGQQLVNAQQVLQQVVAKDQPQSTSVQFTIFAIAAPSPLRFISVDVRAVETSQNLDPKTLAPVGPASSSPMFHTSYTMVIENGAWKVSAQIKEQA